MFNGNSSDIGNIFGVDIIMSDEMVRAIERWDDIARGVPPWLNAADDIESVNMAKLIADTRAKLVALDIDIAISGSARADYLQELANALVVKLADKIAVADTQGGMIIKYNGKSWDFVLPDDFGATHTDNNGDITGAIFASYASQNGEFYTRLEYHRFEGEEYVVTNKAFKNRMGANGKTELGRAVPLSAVDAWAELSEEVTIAGLKHPLFAYYRVPGVNNIDPDSPLGVACFAGAETELKAVDIAISRKNAEIEDSKHITFVGQQVIKDAANNAVELPRFVRGLGMGMDDINISAIHEHTPTLLTDARIKDINFNLSLAGVKCGFSEGVFVLDGRTGSITATQVNADDRDTVQSIKTERDALRNALEQAIYGADALTTLYNQAPLGNYEIVFNFGDITYSYGEDKNSWKYYVAQGWMPKYLYFMKFEGMSEEDAKRFVAEAEQANTDRGLFGIE